MYGIVNKAIEDLVIANFGPERWESIKKRSGIDVDYFLSTEPYDDGITYSLAGAVSEEMGISVEEVLIAFGEYWILKTAKERYSALMAAGGNSLREFLLNLPDFHTRIMLMYPKLTPPEFQITDILDDSVCLHYFSKRDGLQGFVIGLLQGLSKYFDTQITVDILKSRLHGDDHEVFKITWR